MGFCLFVFFGEILCFKNWQFFSPKVEKMVGFTVETLKDSNFLLEKNNSSQ
jgi:hypothetical protein